MFKSENSAFEEVIVFEKPPYNSTIVARLFGGKCIIGRLIDEKRSFTPSFFIRETEDDYFMDDNGNCYSSELIENWYFYKKNNRIELK